MMDPQLRLFADDDGRATPPADLKRGDAIAWQWRGPVSGVVVGVHETGVSARRDPHTCGRTHLLRFGTFWRLRNA